MAFAYQDKFDFAVILARKAGNMIKIAFDQPKETLEKSSVMDLVTKTDNEVEQMIMAEISKQYPTDKMIGEETTAQNPGQKVVLTGEPTWIIDPVDGTTNFVHSFPYPCVLITFMANGEVQFGICFNPIRDEFVSGRLGHGSTLNGEKITVSSSSPSDVPGSLLLTEIGSSKDPERLDKVFGNMRKLIEAGAHGARSLGSCGQNIAAVACGRADAFYEAGMHIWDYSGVSLILREAGGATIDMGGGDLDLCARRIIAAANMPLAIAISKVVDLVAPERD